MRARRIAAALKRAALHAFQCALIDPPQRLPPELELGVFALRHAPCVSTIKANRNSS
jgi:hypothetical protein